MEAIPTTTQVPQQKFFHMPRFQSPNYQKPVNYFNSHQYRQHVQQVQSIEFDGKRLRKAVARKTVDYNSAIVEYLEARVWQRDHRDRRSVQPDVGYYIDMLPPLSMLDNPINAVTTKFVRISTNKMRCPIFCVAWTPEGRRLVTGASSGEFTLWNGLTFNFETILQAHDSPVRCMVWSHNDSWMVTGDHAGYVKYWQSNMNNVKMFQAHKEPLRGISFCPTDTKFVTGSDDGTVRIWDFFKCHEEKILRGHGADVKCVDWHPQKALIVSGSKDSQQPIKLWDPKSGQSLATLHAHKSTVMEAKWNQNGNWLLTASRDHLLKLFDIRNMSQEVQTFRGHKKEATSLGWHPIHEKMFASGGSDGSVMFWVVGADKEVGAMEQAHDSCVWSLAWHPLGHILCSGSNDHTSKFWTRNRPGDKMRDKYNLNTLPKGQEEASEYDESGPVSSIPGMGLEYGLPDHLRVPEPEPESENLIIPGLDFGVEENSSAEKAQIQKKIPFSKPIPKQFQQQWMESKQPLLLAPPSEDTQRNENDMHMYANQLPPTSFPPPMPPPPPGMMPDHQHLSFPRPPITGDTTHNPQGQFTYSNVSGPRPMFPPPPRMSYINGERPGLSSSEPPSQPHYIDQESNFQGNQGDQVHPEDYNDGQPSDVGQRNTNVNVKEAHRDWASFVDNHSDHDARVTQSNAMPPESSDIRRSQEFSKVQENEMYGMEHENYHQNKQYSNNQEFHLQHAKVSGNTGVSSRSVQFKSEVYSKNDSDMRSLPQHDSDLRTNVSEQPLESSSYRPKRMRQETPADNFSHYSEETENMKSKTFVSHGSNYSAPMGRGSYRSGTRGRPYRGRTFYRGGGYGRGMRGGYGE